MKKLLERFMQKNRRRQIKNMNMNIEIMTGILTVKYNDKKQWKKTWLWVNPDEEDFNIFNAVNKIHRHIKKLTKELTEESTKKSLIDKILRRLLELEFKKITQKSK